MYPHISRLFLPSFQANMECKVCFPEELRDTVSECIVALEERLSLTNQVQSEVLVLGEWQFHG